MAKQLDKKLVSKTLHRNQSVDSINSKYEVSDLSEAARTNEEYLKIKNIPDLIHALENNKDGRLDLDARIICVSKEGKAVIKKYDKKSFLETYRVAVKKELFRESLDSFSLDELGSPNTSNTIGKDFTPLLGGPFSKQLYIRDYLDMHAKCFHASTHDPVAIAYLKILCNFVLGRGFQVTFEDKTDQAIWEAFEEVNNLQNRMKTAVRELAVAGEQMIWWLPNNDTKIAQRIMPGQEPSKGLIPRIRFIDPSVIWDICTMPEDLERVIFYQWVAPTQFQMYTGKLNDKPVPSLKFIYQQIPAEQIDHFKVNAFSNEKRGRSDLFAALDYLKRLRDCVSYEMIAHQKATAWSIDTMVDGTQTDIDNYISDQSSIGTIPPPGSEFVHSKKIERKYLSNEGSGGRNLESFNWAFRMACASLGVPESWIISNISGGATKANAVVSTEPVFKMLEDRRLVVEDMLRKMAKRLGLKSDMEVNFPELISQDRSAKLKDLALSVSQKWVSNERAAEIAAKELDINKYDYQQEQENIKKEQSANELPDAATNPLTTPASNSDSGFGKMNLKSPSSMSSDERNKVAKTDAN